MVGQVAAEQRQADFAAIAEELGVADLRREILAILGEAAIVVGHCAGGDRLVRRDARHIFALIAEQRRGIEAARSDVFAIVQPRRPCIFGGAAQRQRRHIVGDAILRTARRQADNIVEEILILRVGVAERCVEAEGLGHLRDDFGLKALDVGRRSVANNGFLRARRSRRRRLHHLFLLVVIFGVVESDVGAQRAVEPVGLQPGLISVDRFGLIGAERGGRCRAAVEPARTETAREGHISELTRFERIFGVGAPGEFVEAVLARTIGRRAVGRQDDARRGADRAGDRNASRAVEGWLRDAYERADAAVIVENFLLVFGVARPERNFELIRQTDLRVRKARVGGSVMIDILAEHRGRPAAQYDAEVRRLIERVAAVEIITADEQVDGIAEFGEQAKLLAELVIFLFAAGLEEIGGAAVEILRHRFLVLDVTGHRRKRDGVAEVDVDIAGDAVDIVANRRIDVAERRVQPAIGQQGAVALGDRREAGRTGRSANDVAARFGQSRRDRFAAFAAVLIGDLRGDGVAGRDQRGDAAGQRFIFAFAAALGDVVIIAVGLVIIAERLERDEAAERTRVDDKTAALGVEAAISELAAHAEVFGRLGAGDVDHAADGVATEQRALRTAKNFETLEVEAVEQLAGVGADEYAVDDDADRRVKALFDIFEADPADRDSRSAGARADRVNHEAGNAPGDVADVVDRGGFQRGLIECSDGDRDRLHAFCALLCGDDDFAERTLIVFGGRLLRQRRGGECQRDK